MSGPLTGIHVLDLSRVLAGPWCTQIFADLGATVIKVERPGTGDETRAWGPPWLEDESGRETGDSAYYLAANRGKHSITVDISQAEGRQIIEALAAKCDFLVENFKCGDLGRRGLGYEQLARVNPRLIYCSITGFGQTGPRAEQPGYDYVIQAMGGLMSVTGLPDGAPGGGPQRVGLAVSDLTSGMNAAIAILAALYERERSGKGQHIDIALLDVQVSWLANQAQNYFVSGKVPGLTGSQHPNLAPYQVFAASDSPLVVAVGNDAQFTRFCDAVGRPELARDARFSTNAGRVRNCAVLSGLLEELFRTRSCREWLRCLEAADIPCGPIQTIDQVFEDPQVLHRNMCVDMQHTSAGTIPGIANPIKYSRSKVEYDKGPPLLGEDTDTILSGFLGLDEGRIAALKASGVV